MKLLCLLGLHKWNKLEWHSDSYECLRCHKCKFGRIDLDAIKKPFDSNIKLP